MLKLISFINFRKTYLRIICTAGLNQIRNLKHLLKQIGFSIFIHITRSPTQLKNNPLMIITSDFMA